MATASSTKAERWSIYIAALGKKHMEKYRRGWSSITSARAGGASTSTIFSLSRSNNMVISTPSRSLHVPNVDPKNASVSAPGLGRHIAGHVLERGRAPIRNRTRITASERRSLNADADADNSSRVCGKTGSQHGSLSGTTCASRLGMETVLILGADNP